MNRSREQLTIKFNGKLKERTDHFTNKWELKSDYIIGSIIAEKIGDTFITFNSDTPVEQWTTIARALRYHGINITVKQRE